MKGKKVNLLGTAWNIYYVDGITNDLLRSCNVKDTTEDLFWFGLTDGTTKSIYISLKNRDGKPLREDIVRDTLAHELVHAFLGEGAYEQENMNEPLVEWLAKCMIAIINQKVI